jgi:hypothetical protein
MAPLDDVEFFADDDTAVTTDEDAVEIGARRVPRWANAAGGALVAAIFIGIIATRPDPTAGPKESTPPTVVSTGDPADAGRVGPVLHLDGPADAREIVIHRDQLFVLRDGGVSVVALASGRVNWMPLRGPYSVPANGSTRLLFDADADRLWVVAMGARTAQLVEFNASRMLAVRRVDVNLVVLDATAMDGHVYLGTSTGLADLAPGAAQPVVLPGTRGVIGAVAADPARNRVLALDLALDARVPATKVVAVTTRGVVSRRAFGDLADPGLAVVGDAIWVGGNDGRHSVIARLDPQTLARVQTSPVAPEGDRIDVWPGTDDVWVSGTGPGLWCIDADTGDIRQHWPSETGPVTSQRGHGPVQSRTGRAYVIDAGQVVSLDLVGCAG